MRAFFLVVAAMTFAFLAGCAGQRPVVHRAPPPMFEYHEEGIASWYGPGFQGRRTASGERFDQKGFTCAHRTLPFGARVRVTNLSNDRSVEVTVNDRGPALRSRLIDLSKSAAASIDLIASGVARVRVDRIE